MAEVDKDLEELRERIGAVEQLTPRFDDLTSQLALEVGNTPTARTRGEVISLVGFRALTGSPVLETGSTSVRWRLDPDTTEEILSPFVVPLDYVGGGTIRLYYTMGNATSGTVRWYVELAAVEEGETLNTAGTQLVINDTVQSTAVNLGIVDFDMAGAGEVLTAGDCLNVLVGRSGGHGDDDATGDAYLHAVVLRYTAFF